MSDAGQPLRLAPFRAITYSPGVDLAAVICPPYDVISASALEEFEAAHPHNIVHLTVPRPNRATARPRHARRSDEDRYTYARNELQRWLAAGILRSDRTPALYVYEHMTASGSAIGLVGGVGLDGPVLPHENTFPGPVRDRAALMKATQAQLEPILLTYDGDGPASDVVDAVAATPPDRQVDVRAGAGIGADESHRIWRVTDATALGVIERDLATRSALIADGHHRFAAYRAVHAEDPASTGTGYGLALLVDAVRHPLELRGVHRSVAGLPFEQAAARAAKGFDVVPLDAGTGAHEVLANEPARTFVIGDDHHRALLRSVRSNLLDEAVPAGRPEGWRYLGAAVLTDVLLARLWGLSDADERVMHHHDEADALDTATRSGGVAVIVAPPALSDILALAAQGARMPQKSTSFGPKPWTGLLMRRMDS